MDGEKDRSELRKRDYYPSGDGCRDLDEDDDDEGLLAALRVKMEFLAPPPKASFSHSAKASAKDTKDLLKVWHNSSQKQGPHRADVEVFEKYIEKVIGEERDMEKARKLVIWLDWTVEEGLDGVGKVQWRKTMDSVKKAVQEAMKARGLGPMKFE